MIDEQSAKAFLAASKLAYSYGTISGPAPGYQWLREFIDPETGFHAQVFKNSANSYIVAFTGTEPSFQDAYADLNLGWTQWSAGREPLLAFLQTLGPLCAMRGSRSRKPETERGARMRPIRLQDLTLFVGGSGDDDQKIAVDRVLVQV